MSTTMARPKRRARQQPIATCRHPIHVDRWVKPTYPEWKRRLANSLERNGMSDYILPDSILLWLHDGQKGDSIETGTAIYDYLKTGNVLRGFANLQDGIAIQQQISVEGFRRLFGEKKVCLWGSVVWSRTGHRYVPFLEEVKDQIVIGWKWLENGFDCNEVALRFAN